MVFKLVNGKAIPEITDILSLREIASGNYIGLSQTT